METVIRALLEQQGIRFVGIQKCVGNNDLVLINNSYNSTVAVRVREFSLAKVKEALQKSEERWNAANPKLK